MTIRAVTAEILRRHGVEPAMVNVQAEPPFNLVAWRTEQATRLMGVLVPSMFAEAQPDHSDVAAWVRRFLADPADCPSLMLAGPTGTGKTWQTFGALKVILAGRARHGLGLTAKVTNHPDLNDSLRPKPDNSHTWALEPYLSADLLILDDVGAGKQSEWTGDSLYRLVDHRWSNRLPSIFTTNLPPKRLVEAVGDRIVSRLADAVQVDTKGPDRRWGRHS